MARFNEILAARYNRFLQKLFVLKGGPPAPQLSSEIMCMFPLFSGRENRYLEGWNSFAFARGEIATAAIDSVLRLRNPANSQVVAVFERLVCASPLTASPILRQQASTNDLPTVFVVGNKRLDSRGQTDSVLITSENSGGGGALLNPARMLFNTGPNGNADFIISDVGEIPLLPGDALELDNGVVNQACTFSFLWRERSLEESERF
jgi:hypothetical protein